MYRVGTLVFAVGLAACTKEDAQSTGTPSDDVGQVTDLGSADSVDPKTDGGDTSGGPDVGPLTTFRLRVDRAEARSCECLLTDPNGALHQVVFGASVEGRQIRRGDRVGVAFFRKADAALDEGAVSLSLKGTALNGVVMARASCFDKAGAELAGAKVEIAAP